MAIYSDVHLINVPENGISMGFHSGDPDSERSNARRFLVIAVSDGAGASHRLCISTDSPDDAVRVLNIIARHAADLAAIVVTGDRTGHVFSTPARKEQ